MVDDVDIVVFGASGHGMVVCDIVLACGDGLRMEGFIDDDPRTHGTRVLEFPVIGALEDLVTRRSRRIAMGIGNNVMRRRQFARVIAQHFTVTTLVHPRAAVSPRATIGVGSVVMAHATINVAAEIGEDTILNTSSSIDHHCLIGAHAHIGPGAVLAGRVTVGDEAVVGASAVILPGVTIGPRATVGAGAVVTADVPAGLTVAGVPARVLPGSAARTDTY
jgi:acetyltransferase EpsM